MSAIIRLDKIKANAHLANGVCASDLEQGSVVVLGSYDNANDLYTVAAPAAITDKVVLVASVPMGYVEPDFEANFTNVAGKKVRLNYLELGDVVTITDDNITGATVVGQFVAPAATAVKMAAKASLTTEVSAFKVLAKETLAGKAATVLEVVRA